MYSARWFGESIDFAGYFYSTRYTDFPGCPGNGSLTAGTAAPVSRETSQVDPSSCLYGLLDWKPVFHHLVP